MIKGNNSCKKSEKPGTRTATKKGKTTEWYLPEELPVDTTIEKGLHPQQGPLIQQAACRVARGLANSRPQAVIHALQWTQGPSARVPSGGLSHCKV